LLLDDELPGLSYLKLLCEQIPELEVVRAFNDPEVFLSEYPELEFDFCILDIEMPGKNGIEVAAILKDKPVIFTTAYKEYATDAFDLDAVDYLVKPVKFDRLKHAVNKAFQRNNARETQPGFFKVNTDKGNSLIYFDKLVYVQTSDIDSRDKIAYFDNGSSLILKNMSFGKLTGNLPDSGFCQVNKRELVALSRVQHFSTEQVVTDIFIQPEKALVLQLGEAYRADFIRKVSR
jgi:DNA-binding LytR/AlgR family response regulator